MPSCPGVPAADRRRRPARDRQDHRRRETGPPHRLRFLRVDTIEQAILRSTPLGRPLGPAGYVVARAVAADLLRTGASVIAECVNPLAVTRDAWRATGLDAGARVLETEIVCSDPAEHRRRAETRDPGIPGLVPPTWAEIVAREYERWDRDRLVVDTAGRSVGEAVSVITAAFADQKP